jgi:hypothetical protein
MEDKICEGLIYLELEGIKIDKIPKFKFERSMRAPQLTENGENILARGEFFSWCSVRSCIWADNKCIKILAYFFFSQTFFLF